MRTISRNLFILPLLVVFLGVSSCTKESTVQLNEICFTAKNITNPNSAEAGANIKVSVSVTVGDSEPVTIEKLGSQLLANPGDEIEVSFVSTHGAQEAAFTLPDGNIEYVTAEAPSFTFTVGEFRDGDQIYGITKGTQDKTDYTLYGWINLIHFPAQAE